MGLLHHLVPASRSVVCPGRGEDAVCRRPDGPRLGRCRRARKAGQTGRRWVPWDQERPCSASDQHRKSRRIHQPWIRRACACPRSALGVGRRAWPGPRPTAKAWSAACMNRRDHRGPPRTPIGFGLSIKNLSAKKRVRIRQKLGDSDPSIDKCRFPVASRPIAYGHWLRSDCFWCDANFFGRRYHQPGRLPLRPRVQGRYRGVGTGGSAPAWALTIHA